MEQMMELRKIIAIASDHAGFAMKEKIESFLQGENYDVLDVGCHGIESCDYADYGHHLAEAVKSGRAHCAIALCGSGLGISMTLNRHTNVRAALCHNEETARLSRQHNDANVLVMGARMLEEKMIFDCIKIFLDTEFEGGRHLDRIKKIEIM